MSGFFLLYLYAFWMQESISSGTLHTTGTGPSIESRPQASVDTSMMVEEAVSKMNISKDPVKFHGTSGKLVNVTSNYLKLQTKANSGIYEYEVRFNPNVDMRNERFRLLRQLEPVIGPTKVDFFVSRRIH